MSADTPATANVPAAAPDNRLLIDLAETAILTSLSLKTVKRMAAAEELPGVVKVRRRVLVRVEDLRKWVEAGCPELAKGGRKSRSKR